MTEPVGTGAQAEAQADTIAAVHELETFRYEQELKRGLSLWELTAYGVNYMAPLGGALLVGVLMATTGGNAFLPYLLGGLCILIIAGAYPPLVAKWPLAGSAYNFISKGISPYLGFMAGWVLVLDYMLFPAVGLFLCGSNLNASVREIPIWVGIVVFAVLNAVINILGVNILGRFGVWMLGVATVFVAILCFGWIQWIVAGYGWGALLSWDAAFGVTSAGAVATATALACVNITGFDAMTTLVEESRRPKKDIPRAFYLTILGGVFFFLLTGYFGSLALSLGEAPGYLDNPDLLTVPFWQASHKTQGAWLSNISSLGILVTFAVFGVVSTAASSRLLYGMGRDRLLPKSIFGAINKRWQTPHWSILFITISMAALAIFVDINLVFQFINFGAFSAYLCVNITCFYIYIIKKTPAEGSFPIGSLAYYLRYGAWPLLAMAVLVWLFTGLQQAAWIAGPIWAVIGLAWLAFATKGFKQLPPELQL